MTDENLNRGNLIELYYNIIENYKIRNLRYSGLHVAVQCTPHKNRPSYYNNLVKQPLDILVMKA